MLAENKRISFAIVFTKDECLLFQWFGTVPRLSLVECIPLAVGGDVMIIPDKNSNAKYCGITGNIGLGTPGAEWHVEWGKTYTIYEINIYDIG